MSFASKLLRWFEANGRHDLPWQIRNNAYPVWVSEIMLQQTQVKTVIPYFKRFIEQFPDISQLANAKQDHVLHNWSGLGYYARARNLHKAANLILNEHQGIFPDDINQVIKLPGIGRSTAGAILAQSFGQRHPILDGNVKRVLARYYRVEGWPGQKKTEDRLWQFSEQNTPHKNVADYTQAIMDLGATLCTRSKPKCGECPVQKECESFIHDVTDRFPNKKPGKKLQIKFTTFLLVYNKNEEILLIKRPPAGIWGGLWCLPEVPYTPYTPDIDSSVDVNNQDGFSYRISAPENMNILRHTFSHYHLDYTVVPATLTGDQPSEIHETDQSIWYNPQTPAQIGLATPISKIITKEAKHGKHS